EARELKLDGDAFRPRRVDHRLAVARHGSRGERGDLAGIRIRMILGGPGPERGGVGVETEDDLALPLFDERREPIGKGRAHGLSRPTAFSGGADHAYIPALTAFLRADPALNRGTRLAAI